MSFHNVEVKFKKKRGEKKTKWIFFLSLKWMRTKQYYTNPHLLRRGGTVSSVATSLLAKK